MSKAKRALDRLFRSERTVKRQVLSTFERQQRRLAILLIILGIVSFLARYLPLNLWGTTMSFEQRAVVCNSVLGVMNQTCNWIKSLDIISLIAPAVLVVWGCYILYKQQE
jgi:hypothetical protein